MAQTMSDGALYPNQQLRAVSLETFFKGRLSTLAGFGAVQERFKDRLDNLFVPNVQPGEPFALRPYQLRPANQKESLALAMNQATYVSFDYPGFTRFVDVAMDLLAPTLEILRVDSLERVIHRYDNQMIIQRDERGRLPIKDILKLMLPDGPAGDELVALDIGWSRPWTNGLTETKVWVEQQDGWCVFKWSIAAVVSPGGAVADLRRSAESAHDEARRRFEELITDEFRSFLRQTEADE